MEKKVLVVVDYQNDFVTGALGFEDAIKLESGIAKLIEEYHKNDDIVICTMDTHNSDYLNTEEGKNLPVEHCIEDSYGWELYGSVGEIAKKYRLTCITKPTFPSDELMIELRSINQKMKFDKQCEITEIALCGIVTNMCVISNAVVAKMALPNAHIKVHKDLCASFDKEMHNKAIDVMQSMQMEIV